MRRRWQVAAITTAVAVAAGMAALAPAGAAESAGPPPAVPARWGTAQNIPGLLALNRGGGAGITALSCGAPGDCSTGGWYTDAAGRNQAFVASQADGRWRAAQEVPGTAALNAGGVAEVDALSCPAAGDCTAVGSFTTRTRAVRGFTVTESGGVWGAARLLPGRPGRHGYPVMVVVSCAAPGDCSAGGTDGYHAFAATEASGRWGAPQPVPGLPTYNSVDYAEVDTVSCTAPGDCSAGGQYPTRSRIEEGFVVSERNGAWGRAEPVPGLAALNAGPGAGADVESVSCTAPGDCAADGVYHDLGGPQGAFVVTQAGGSWGRAEPMPGTSAGLSNVSCAADECSTVGAYTTRGGTVRKFEISQVHGSWGRPQYFVTAYKSAGTVALSCAAPGDCSVGGSYTGRSGSTQAFVISQADGRWDRGEEVPGSHALNTAGDAQVTAVSCPAAGHCTAAGFYLTGHTDSPPMQVFVVSQA